MILWSILVILFLGSLFARAQDETITLPDLLQSAQEWVDENLDPAFLQSLPELDQQQVRQVLRDLQSRLQGDYGINLAALREPANVLLPVLESYEETRPYVVPENSLQALSGRFSRVKIVQAAHLRNRIHLPILRRIHRPWFRTILLQR